MEYKVFIPPVDKGLVIKVYDGDTFTCGVEMFGDKYRFNVRLRGVDCPEIRTRNAREKTAGLRVRDSLRHLILDKHVRFTNVAYDKYGRLLADVYLADLSLATWLIEHRMAVAYDGGTKHPPEDWLSYLDMEPIPVVRSRARRLLDRVRRH